MCFSLRPAPAQTLRLFLATAILLLAFLFRTGYLGATSLWHDERFTQIRVTGSLAHTLRSTLETGNHGPLYFLLLHLFPHTNDFSIRLFSALTGLLSVAVIIGITTQLFGRRAPGLWAGLLLACNPFHVWYSRMARPYSLLMLLSALTSYVFIELYRGQRTRRMWLAFTALSMLTYLTHYFGLLVGLAQYLTLFATLRQESRFFRRWIAAQIIACLPASLWLLALVWSGPSELAMGWISAPSIVSPLRTVWNLSVGVDSWFPALTLFGGLASLALIAASALAVFQARKAHPAAVYWVMLLITPIVVTLSLSAIVPMYLDRYLAEIIPAFVILPVLGFEWLRRQTSDRLARALLVLICFTGAVNISGILIGGQHEREGWRDVAAYLRANAQTGDTFVVEQAFVLDLLAHYYGVESTAERGVLGIDPGEIEPAIILDPAVEPQRLWVIYLSHVDDPHYTLVQPHSDPFAPDSSPVSNWLVAHREQVVEHKHFNGIQLILLDLSAAA